MEKLTSFFKGAWGFVTDLTNSKWFAVAGVGLCAVAALIFPKGMTFGIAIGVGATMLFGLITKKS